jgi:branched-chain amino acid aminotransferase
MVEKAEFIWFDGELVPWADAQIHVLTHTLHYGLGAFEGIRCYRRADGRSAIFRLRKHILRLLDSCRIVTLASAYSVDEIVAACVETVRANQLDACYMRPIVFVGDGAMGLYAIDNPSRTAVITWRWGSYLGDEGIENGIRAQVSSYQRGSVNSSFARGKLVGQYINSIMAKRAAVQDGYHEAILLDSNGFVAEASGENIFMVKDGTIFTPPLASPILAGITRDTAIVLLREMGEEVVEQTFTRDDMYIADEVFFTGTAAEIAPVREIDRRTIGTGRPGRVTRAVQERYFDVVRGTAEDHYEWLTFVDGM